MWASHAFQSGQIPSLTRYEHGRLHTLWRMSSQHSPRSQRRQIGSWNVAGKRWCNHDRHDNSNFSGWEKRCISNSVSQKEHSHGPSSVSSDEVTHFSRLASSWWDPHGPSRLLHLMNPLRHDFIRFCFSSSSIPTTSRSYLDIGCGGGIFATSAARLPSTSSVVAIDPTQECISVAELHQRSDPALQPPKLTYLNCAIESLPPSIAPVDVITLFEVVEHVASPSSFLAQCVPHLKTGGWIIGSTISRSSLSYLTTKVIAEAPLIGVVPQGTHDWNKYINPAELRDWFETQAAGTWGEFQVQGVVYIPGLGWKVVNKSEDYGNYFFGIQKMG